MDVYLETLGCRLNEAERARWGRELRASGHRVTARPQEAQVMVLNTCAVTVQAAKRSRKASRQLHRLNPHAKLVLTGCYAELEPDTVATLAGVDLVIGNHDKEALVAQIQSLDLAGMPRMATDPEAAPIAAGRTRAFVKVQDGCRNRCAFCIVTVARGAERSLSIDQVVEQVGELEGEGFREVVLTGVHLGGYGGDLGTDLTALIGAVLARTTVPWIRLGSLEPWDLPSDFFALWRDARMCPHLHLPLQSGSDSVLRRMARRCSTSRYRALAHQARAAGVSLTTDLLVGFPGETEEEFAETLAFVEEMDFAHVHVFPYSARPGTVAARMKGRLSGPVLKERVQAVHALAARCKAERMRAEIGRIHPVHWEGRGVPEDGGWRWQGYTHSYLRIETVVDDERSLRDVIGPVRIERASEDRLFGSILGLEGQRAERMADSVPVPVPVPDDDLAARPDTTGSSGVEPAATAAGAQGPD